MWAAYTRALQTHPLRTNAASASVIAASGDALAQWLEQRPGAPRAPAAPAAVRWDAERTGYIFVWGAVWMGAPMSLWYRWLATRFGDAVAPKLVLNQVATVRRTTCSFCHSYSICADSGGFFT